MSSFEAAIFDLDGTLVDTMPLHYEAYRRVFAEVGLELTMQHFRAMAGGVAAETIPRLLAGRPCAISAAEIHRRKLHLAESIFEQRPPNLLQASKLIDLLEGRLPLAIASSGSSRSVTATLNRLGWTHRFDTVVSGEDVDRGKPAPDQFLLAADRLSIAPEKCIVFEDSDVGLAAAAAAGMDTFDVRTNLMGS